MVFQGCGWDERKASERCWFRPRCWIPHINLLVPWKVVQHKIRHRRIGTVVHRCEYAEFIQSWVWFFLILKHSSFYSHHICSNSNVPVSNELKESLIKLITREEGESHEEVSLSYKCRNKVYSNGNRWCTLLYLSKT